MNLKILIILSFISIYAEAREIKGFNLTENGDLEFESSSDLNNKTAAQIAVDSAKNLGANHIVLNVRAKMEGPYSVDIIPLTGKDSISQEARKMRSLIQYIQSLNMTVGVRPILFVVGPNGEFPYSEKLGDGREKVWWHGNIQPEYPDRWFESFQLYLDRYLTIAKLARIDEFTIGAELYSMTVGIEDQWSEHPYGFPGRWNKLLKYVRAKLGDDVRIMYDINFTDDTDTSTELSRAGGEMERWRYRLVDLAEPSDAEERLIWEQLIEFWNGLDAIGIDMYRSLAFKTDIIPREYEVLIPFLSQRALSYANQLDVSLLEISIYTGDIKPAILKEVGFRSVENAFIDPFTYATAQGELNILHQAAGYESLFKGFWEPDFEWFSGFVFWDISLDPKLHGKDDRGFSPVGKKETEDVIKGYFQP